MDIRKRRSGGFTLIELMIVVAIVALLAAIAFPAYNNQVTRSHRSDAKIALQNIAQRLERCLTVYGSYTHASCAVHTDVDTGGADSADYGGEGFYVVAEANAGDIAASSFVLTATATAGGPQVGDSECDAITLSNTGVKGAVDDGNNDTSGVCW